jgi:exodeoxyribonuclease VII small subunit
MRVTKEKNEEVAETEERFEDQLERLEDIVGRLEDDEVGLEEALDLFEQGMGLAAKCRSRLNRVEQRVARLLEDGTTEDMEIETS